MERRGEAAATFTESLRGEADARLSFRVGSASIFTSRRSGPPTASVPPFQLFLSGICHELALEPSVSHGPVTVNLKVTVPSRSPSLRLRVGERERERELY